MAANAQGVSFSFKSEILQAIHNLGVTVTRSGTGADTLKAALYAQNQSMTPSVAVYTTSGEVTGTGYVAGGNIVTNAVAPTTSGGSTAFWTPSSNLTWTGVTLSTLFDSVLIYNSSQGNRSVGVFTFGAQTITSGNFSLTMPANTATSALIQLT